MTPEHADMIRATWLRHCDYITRELSPRHDRMRVPAVLPSTDGAMVGSEETVELLMFRLEPGSYSSNSAHRITCEGLVLARGVKYGD